MVKQSIDLVLFPSSTPNEVCTMHEMNDLTFTKESAQDILKNSPSISLQRKAYMWLYGYSMLDRSLVWTPSKQLMKGDIGFLASKVVIWDGCMWVNEI